MINISTRKIHLVGAFLAALLLLSACTVAKLEARLEANPQCKDIINPKTGALMPCPGTDKAFYAAAGLGPTKTVSASASGASGISASSGSNAAVGTATSAASFALPSNSPLATGVSTAPVECKPSLHQKTGSLMPCPAP